MMEADLSSSWLPPLNSHNNSVITFDLQRQKQCLLPEYLYQDRRITTPSISVQLSVAVKFRSEDKEVKETINGLNLCNSFNIPANAKDLNPKVSEILLNKTLIPFELENVRFTERTFRVRFPNIYTIQRVDELIERITVLLAELIKHPWFKCFPIVPVNFVIEKEIVLVKNEFEARKCLYLKQKEAPRVIFEKEQQEVISRPRIEIELWGEIDAKSSIDDDNDDDGLVLVQHIQDLLLESDDEMCDDWLLISC